MMGTSYLQMTAWVAVGAPAMTFVILVCLRWFRVVASERWLTRLVGGSFLAAAIAIALAAVSLLANGASHARVSAGDWFAIGQHHLPVELVLDGLSLTFAGCGAVLVGLVASFSRRYLHRDRGFFRFYVLLTLLGTGYQIVVLGGNLQLVLFGWELVGITSALLIAFFHHRPGPVRHGLRAFITYRVCDIALLAAVVWLNHLVGTPAIVDAGTSWNTLLLPQTPFQTSIVALLLLFACMGKSAQLPFTGWLPRAMEGPTPSSAIFYGALSIHLGPYLLLRASPLIQSSAMAAGTLIFVGLVTALHATFVGRVQTDIKSALAYASVTQVGLIFVEIGLGLERLAVVHIIGHLSIRTLQILRSPSLLHDYHHLELAMGRQLPRTGRHLERLVPKALQPWLYRFALERSYVDALFRDYLGAPLGRLLRRIDDGERRWVNWLGGEPSQRALRTLRPPEAETDS